MPRLYPFALMCVIALGACQPGSSVAPSLEPVASGATPEERGLAFAELRCSRCHGVGVHRISRNPYAPPFESVANRPGVSRGTLAAWLRNAHDFPTAMNFFLDDGQIADLTAYMLTLQSADYTPPIE